MTETPYSIADQQAAEQRAREAARLKEQQDFGRLARLLENEDVQWLFATHLQPIVERELAASHKLSLGKEKCWEYLQRHEVSAEIVGMLASEHARLEPRARIAG